MKLAIPGVAVAVVLHGLVLVHATSAAPQLPKVPKVFNAGPDGMPQLPNVERLLTDYQEVKQQLDSEASDLAQHVQQVEASGIKLLAQQKEVYDKKLQDQEKENQALVRNNAHLAKEIITARQQNTKMKKDLVHKEKLMSFRQNQLRGLEQELDRSQKFFQQVVDATNFVEEGTLTPAPTEDVDETELLEKDAVSFLEVSKKRKHRGKTSLRQPLLTEESALMLEAVRQSANGTEIKDSGDASDAEKDGQIITLLTEDLQKLHQAELRGETALKMSFQQSFAAGKTRREALRKQESVLNAELKQTQAAGEMLKAKSAKVQDALDQMQRNLRKGGDLFGHLQKVAVAPVKEVQPLLKAGSLVDGSV